MLEIIQLMFNKRLGPAHVCILNVLQHLAFALPIVAYFYNVVVEVFVLIALNLDNVMGSKPTFVPTTFTYNRRIFHLFCGNNVSNNLLPC